MNMRLSYRLIASAFAVAGLFYSTLALSAFDASDDGGALMLALAPTDPAEPDPGTGTTSKDAWSCKTAYPNPQPFWIDSTQVAGIIDRVMASDPTKDRVDIEIHSNDNDTLVMEVEFPLGLSATQSTVRLLNLMNWEKKIFAIDGNHNCRESAMLWQPGGAQQMSITPEDTTWLELRKPKAGFPAIYWATVLRFTQNDFWRAFGGRKVTFYWLHD